MSQLLPPSSLSTRREEGHGRAAGIKIWCGSSGSLRSTRLLAVLCVCLSVAGCSAPGDERPDSESEMEMQERRAGMGVQRTLTCLMRYRNLPGGMGVLPSPGNTSSITSRPQDMYARAAHSWLGAAGCAAGSLLAADSITLGAGDWLSLLPSESVQWRVDEGFISAPDEDFVRLAGGRTAQQYTLTGGAASHEEVTLMMTQSGSYRVRVKPHSPTSFSPPVELRVVVTAGYPSARTSQACYIAPPTSNATKVDLSADLQCTTLNSTSGMITFDTTLGPSEYLSNELLAGVGNTSNVSIEELLIDRELSICLKRKCLTLQVRRHDSWSNPVHSQEIFNEISVQVQGVDTSMYEVVSRGKSVILSDGVLKKWETYQWIGRGGNSVLGNNTCNQFACNVTKLIGPETNLVAWVIIRMDGVPLGQGSPFNILVTGGGFHSFMVDPFYMTGRVPASGGASIRLIPVDKAGNPVKGALSRDGHCDPNSACAHATAAIMAEGIGWVSECYLSGALTRTLVELDRAQIGPFKPDTSCSKRGCGPLVEFFYCDPRFDRTCGVDGTKPFSTGAPFEISSRENEPPECDSCPFGNGEAMIASFDSYLAASCIFNMTFNGTRIQNPIRTQNTFGVEFFGTSLAEGQTVVSILAGEPNATMSTVRYPWANETAKEFAGAIAPNGAFELIVSLQDSWGNPSGGLVGVVAELRHPDVILPLRSPEFNSTTGGFHVVGNVTVSGQYRLQLSLEPFLVPLGGSPFLISITAGEPVVPHSLMLKSPDIVTIDAFGQFFFQARDLYMNFVSSNHPFFKGSTQAPGFWIWVVPRDLKDKDSGLPLEPILDKSGFNILRCNSDPDPCGGNDPGLDAFVAAFRPKYIGKYYLELQYCDPRTHVSGVLCEDDPFAYNHTSMKPPQAPNPCQIMPAGKGGARTGLACTLDQMGFEVYLHPNCCAADPCVQGLPSGWGRARGCESQKLPRARRAVRARGGEGLGRAAAKGFSPEAVARHRVTESQKSRNYPDFTLPFRLFRIPSTAARPCWVV